VDRDAFIEWHIENGIYDIFEDVPFDHFTIIEHKKQDNKTVNVEKNRTIADVTVSSSSVTKKYADLARTLADKSNTLDELKENISNFDGISYKKVATNLVFGDGNTKSDILLLGEAPGEDEDLAGIPFCGRSGKLLTNIFKSIGFNREDLYITNTIFWRPPANRTPTDDEVEMCRPFVEKHIALINPKIIIFVGGTAFNCLIKHDFRNFTQTRQKIFNYSNKYLTKEIKTTPIYHPSFLLRQPYKRKEMWYDLLFIKDNILNNDKELLNISSS
jgi:DNA polymerase